MIPVLDGSGTPGKSVLEGTELQAAFTDLKTTLDARLATIDTRVDGVEALIGSTNTLLTTQNGYLDTVETLIAATNTAVAATNTALATQNGYLDGVETLIGTTNTVLQDTNPSVVVGLTAIPSGTVTRPADTTAYAVGDLIASSTTASATLGTALTVGRVTGGTGNVRRVRVRSSNAATVGTIRVHFFRTAPTVTNGDNGVFLANGVAARWQGSVDVALTAMSDGAAGVGAPNVGGEISFSLPAGATDIFFLLEARTAFTPASAEVYTVEAETFRD